MWVLNSAVSATNCIFWMNSSNSGTIPVIDSDTQVRFQIGGGSNDFSVNYCCVQGGWTGNGNNNINDDNDIDGVDFSLFASCFNKTGHPPILPGLSHTESPTPQPA